MLRKKFIIIPIIPVILGIFVISNANLNTNKIDTLNSKEVVLSTSVKNENKSFVPKTKREIITNKDNIKKSVPIKIKKPTINLGDLKEEDTYAEHDIHNPDMPQYTTDSYYIATNYRSPSGKKLTLIQSTTPPNMDSISKENIENKTSTTKVKGVDAIICEAKGGYTQVIFIRDRVTYNVVGYEINKEDLIKIADSLEFE
ncbi:MAG: DUF4367 domain-containing protein [Clostridium sp.]|uniref:DUF4367 domain-containing protein n=1 Tax=Clostridium sp. TaxID=1506 RepID=UPI0039E82A89